MKFLHFSFRDLREKTEILNFQKFEKISKFQKFQKNSKKFFFSIKILQIERQGRKQVEFR